MGDDRPDPFGGEYGRLVPSDFPVLDPTHPDGPRKMLDVRVPGVDDEQPEPAPARRIEPKPAPIELGFDPVKWAAMPRAERRAVLRHARRQR